MSSSSEHTYPDQHGSPGTDDKKNHYGPGPADPYTSHELDGKPAVADDELRIAGVKRMEVISAQLGPVARGLTYLGCFLVAYAYGLDGTIRYTYQGYATGSYGVHSLLTTVTIIRSIIGAVGQPTAAKIADVFGRLELLLISIFFYIIGTIVECTALSVEGFAGGAVLYQIGYTMAILLVEVIIADLSSLRNRLFFSFVPALPFIINTWISGDITEGVLLRTNWQWGIGMWAIIYPVACILLIVMLFTAQRRAAKHNSLADYRTPFQIHGFGIFMALFWQLDVIGILLMIIAFGFFLTPFTLAGGAQTEWQTAKIIAPLVIGILAFPAFIFWERRCKYPLVPFKLLRDRGVWAGFLVAVTLNTSWYMQGAYLYPMLLVGFDQSIKDATRISSLFSFASVITGTLLGLVVMKVRRLKAFIVFGCCLFTLSFGLLIRYRTGGSQSDIAGLVAAEVLLGIGAGCFSYPTQASVQSRTKHEHVAVITGLYLASYNIGSALGNTISGAVWTQRMPVELSNHLTNQTLASMVYANPYGVYSLYPVGTPERQGMMESYSAVQKILAIIGICLCIPLIAWSLLLRDPVLGDEQSLKNAESEELEEEERSRSWFSWR